MYPLTFEPLYKSYIWGGRNLSSLGKKLPDEGTVAESWELSAHPDGDCIISNGEYAGTTLSELVKKLGRALVGNELPDDKVEKFPLLIKLIDAEDKLSVQVHPDDEYANANENGELGKNEMWYILSAKPGAKLVYDVAEGTSKEAFANAAQNGELEQYLNFIEVKPGDCVNIPAGMLHAIGEGIVLAEVQQNSNTTYRVYDYNRKDKEGNLRPLHIEKAVDVIDFDTSSHYGILPGLTYETTDDYSKTLLVANSYFFVDRIKLNGSICEAADGKKFFIYMVTDGEIEIKYADNQSIKLKKGMTTLIPADLGEYQICGNGELIKSFVPSLDDDLWDMLHKKGYSDEEIKRTVAL